MKKFISSKKIMTVLLIAVVLFLGYAAYSVMNNQINNTFYYVVFDSNGGSRINNLKVKLNDTVSKPEDPTKKGYNFKYWALENTEYDFDSKVRSNIKLIAIWEKEVEEEASEEASLENSQ